MSKISIRILILIVVSGFAVLLLFGLGYCLPRDCNPDEGRAFINQAVHMMRNEYEPLRYRHPALIDGEILATVAEFLDVRPVNRDSLFMLGRGITLVFSIGIVLLLYAVASQIYSSKIGFIAVLFYVVNPLILFYSKQFRPDITMTFLLLLTLHMVLRFKRSRNDVFIILAGLSAGLAVTSKYTGLLSVVPIGWFFIVDMVYSRKLFWKQYIYTIVAFLAGIVIGSPYILIEYDVIRESIEKEARDTHLGADGLTPLGNFFWYVRKFLNIMGNGIFLLAGFGIVRYLYDLLQDWKDVLSSDKTIVYVTGIAYACAMIVLQLHWTRWMLPVVPFLALFAAETLYKLLKRQPRIWIIIVCGLLILPPLTRSFLFIHARYIGDTRVEQERWVRNRGIQSHVIAYDGYTSFSSSKPYSLAVHDLEFYEDQGYHYLVVSSYMYDRYLAEPEQYEKQTSFYEELFNKELVRTFSPGAANFDFQMEDSYGNKNDIRLLFDIVSDIDSFYGPAGPEIRIYAL